MVLDTMRDYNLDLSLDGERLHVKVLYYYNDGVLQRVSWLITSFVDNTLIEMKVKKLFEIACSPDIKIICIMHLDSISIISY